MAKRKPSITAHGRLKGDEPSWEPEPIAVEFLSRYRKFVSDYYGPRCKTRASGCACCEAWALYDLTKTMTV